MTMTPDPHWSLAEFFAASYLAQGWTPIPLEPHGTRPLVPPKALRVTRPTPEDIRAWWQQWPAAGVGLLTGTTAGLVVLALHTVEAAKAFACRMGDQPLSTPVVRTGREVHVYFAPPTRPRPTWVPAQGMTLHAEGSYVATVGTEPGGHPYRWMVPPLEAGLAPLPSWLAGADLFVVDSFPPPKDGGVKERNFRPRTAAELLAQPTEPMTWVWEPYLPAGSLSLLVAFMKVGKSTLVYPLALAVARGEAFLGLSTRQGPVLILAVEEHPRDVRSRLERFGLQPSDPVHVHAGSLAPSTATVAELRRYITTHGIRFVVLDTLGSFWDIGDENNNAEIIKRLRPLLDLARETGAAVLLVHHESKAGGDGGRNIRGGSALFGLVDQSLTLALHGGNASMRKLKALGRYADTPRELIIRLEGAAYRAIGTPADLGLQAQQDYVWAALSPEPRDIEALMAESGLGRPAVDRALRALGERVAREGDGRRGSPFRYRRADSFPSHLSPIGEETNLHLVRPPQPQAAELAPPDTEGTAA